MGVIRSVLGFSRKRRANPLSLALTGLGLWLIVAGFQRTHEVRTIDADELEEMLGFAPFEDITDYQLTIDSTFTGVASRHENLYSTYDRGLPDQKRPCPT